MKILITGASGLIGSELVRELVLKKHKVVVQKLCLHFRERACSTSFSSSAKQIAAGACL